MQEFDIIETPEHVEFQQRLAGIGSRFIAGLVDNLLLALIFLALTIAAFLVLGFGPSTMIDVFQEGRWWFLAFMLVASFFIYWGYFVFFEMMMNGQTPGKRSQRLRVVKEGGVPIAFVDVAIRNLLRVVDGIGGYGVSGIVMFLTSKVQRLGDLAAGTVVISEETRDYAAHADRRKAGLEWEKQVSPETLSATGLKPEEYRALYNYWARRSELTVEARSRVLPRLLEPILERSGRSLPNRLLVTWEGYLDELLTSARAGAATPRADEDAS